MNVYTCQSFANVHIYSTIGRFSKKQAGSLIGSGSGFCVYLDWSFTILLKPDWDWDSDHVLVFLLKLKPAQHRLSHYLVYIIQLLGKYKKLSLTLQAKLPISIGCN